VLQQTFARLLGKLAIGALALLLPACEGGGNFTIPFLGYTTKPNYDMRYKTIYVPTFKNLTFYRGLEFDVTKALVREIEMKTPYKVISDRSSADTELKGTIISLTKSLLNRNQLNEVREAQTVMTCTIVWRDLHTGEVLSAQRKPGALLPVGVSPDTPPVPPLVPLGNVPGLQPAITSAPALPRQPNPGDRAMPTPGIGPAEGGVGGGPIPPQYEEDDGLPPLPPDFKPATVTSLGDFIPEIGGSMTTALWQNATLMATYIVQMMEKPW
jgi:hypothetical protein